MNLGDAKCKLMAARIDYLRNGGAGRLQEYMRLKMEVIEIEAVVLAS